MSGIFGGELRAFFPPKEVLSNTSYWQRSREALNRLGAPEICQWRDFLWFTVYRNMLFQYGISVDIYNIITYIYNSYDFIYDIL